MLTWTTYWFDFDRKGDIAATTNLAETRVFNASAYPVPRRLLLESGSAPAAPSRYTSHENGSFSE
jgi:hypothetical protein